MSEARVLHPSLLREYDIRGVVGSTLFEADARAIGQAFGTRIIGNGGRTVAVGRDGRHSSLALEQALIAGLAATGLEVCRIGCCPTPGLYFAVHHLDAGGGVMVTGSHNPPEYNGFKMVLGTEAFFGADIAALGASAAGGTFAAGEGSSRDVATAGAYLDRLTAGLAIARPLDVVWDCGNGATGPVVTPLVRRLPGSHEILFAEVDGDFPNHHPDPTVPENLAALAETVQRRRADLGVAFDGDGDRIGVVDDTGRILWGDQLLAVLAEDVLLDRPGAIIIGDVKASEALFDRIGALGGVPLMWRTGHSLIKRKMAETGALLAGEMSGHIFFGDRYLGFDDGIYAALRLIETLAGRAEPLSVIRQALPETCNTPELRLPCPEPRKFAVINAARALLVKRSGLDIVDIDGLRVRNSDGWWLLRASNTQDMLVARCESRSLDGLMRVQADLVSILRSVGVEPPAFPSRS